MEIELLSKIYVVNHVREYYQDPQNPEKKYLECKGIGNFHSLEKANEAIHKCKTQKGFKDYPDEFVITEYTIDSIYNDFINKILEMHLQSKKNCSGFCFILCIRR